MHPFLHHQVQKSILRLYEDLATPYSLKCSLLFRAGEWDQLATCRPDPNNYLDSESYWRDASAGAIIRKLQELPTTVDRKAVAEETFLACERSCFRANLRLLPYLSPGLPETELGVHEYFTRARKIASRILGHFPDVIDGRFGPGATYGDRGRFTTVPDKMSSNPTLTTNAWSYHFPWSGTLWAHACASLGRKVSFVEGNRFTTVPKDADKDRGIAVEPSINIFYQLGYGHVIRSRLRKSGINLTDGQDIHRQVAREASIKGHLATMDLSNASDTICSNLVKLLLPRSWFEALDDLRSKKTLFRSSWYLLEKFSSMGNGFTFELESLIFLSLILALDPTGQKLVPGVNVFVYGDDLIVPTEFSRAVISVLSFVGLTVNRRKTYIDGPFRESCGGDYFLGVDVRPHFLKESPNEPQQLISLANGLRRLSKGEEGRSRHTHRAWLGILDALPNTIRQLRGPEGLGDLCVHDSKERWRYSWQDPITGALNGIRYFRCYRPARFRKVAWKNFSPEVTLAAAIYGVPWNNGEIIPRDAVAGYKIGWVPYS